MVTNVTLGTGEAGLSVGLSADPDIDSDNEISDEGQGTNGYEDHYVKVDDVASRRSSLRYALAQNGDISLDQLSQDQLADLIINKSSSGNLRERAFSVLEDVNINELDSEVLERLSRRAPQRYSDWAKNELEWRSESKRQELARKTYVLPRVEAIIASSQKYAQWDTWKNDPFNPGMFFTGKDLERIARTARCPDNRKEATRRLLLKNRCEIEGQNLSRSVAANQALAECQNPYYWNMMVISGLSPYREQAAERLFMLAKDLPDSGRIRNVYERVLQGGSPELKDRAARSLLAFGLPNLSVTNLRYLMFYARGGIRQAVIKELKGREVTDPEQRKHIVEDIARCSRIGPEDICAEQGPSLYSERR